MAWLKKEGEMMWLMKIPLLEEPRQESPRPENLAESCPQPSPLLSLGLPQSSPLALPALSLLRPLSLR